MRASIVLCAVFPFLVFYSADAQPVGSRSHDVSLAQARSPQHAVHLGYWSAHLTGGEVHADVAAAAYTRQIRPWLGAFMRAGYLASVERDVSVIVQVSRTGSDLWRDRKHGFGDVGLEVSPLRFSALGTAHRFSVRLGGSYRVRREERVSLIMLPDFFRPLSDDELAEVLALCSKDDVYCYTESENGEQRQYLFTTYKNRNSDPGIFATLRYALLIRGYEVAAEVGYYRYHKQPLSGTHTYYFGISAGYRF